MFVVQIPCDPRYKKLAETLGATCRKIGVGEDQIVSLCPMHFNPLSGFVDAYWLLAREPAPAPIKLLNGDGRPALPPKTPDPAETGEAVPTDEKGERQGGGEGVTG